MRLRQSTCKDSKLRQRSLHRWYPALSALPAVSRWSTACRKTVIRQWLGARNQGKADEQVGDRLMTFKTIRQPLKLLRLMYPAFRQIPQPRLKCW